MDSALQAKTQPQATQEVITQPPTAQKDSLAAKGEAQQNAPSGNVQAAVAADKAIAVAPRQSKKRRFVTRRSGIHGKGVFATALIAEGTRLIEYKGDRITDAQSEALYSDESHTFLFMLDNAMVIDGGKNGNTSRWINHSCEPNCEANEEGGRMFIDALRDIAEGEEITIDYNLYIEDVLTEEMKRDYPCACGMPGCRGTMLVGNEESEAAIAA
ncbi:MAG: SET domain-containing protein [Burkholderiales bacterium]